MKLLNSLKRKLTKLKNENETLRSDYEQFVQIMNRARRLVTLDGEVDRTAPIFQMEQNGNLVSKEPPISY